ncbi:MAG: alkaline phosphatase family protein [Mollicutes bacterium]|nr:alkaline phosphatase family protein [Mollicutes bacterium]
MNKTINIILKNDFIIPNYNKPNIVDLMRAIYCRYGIKIDVNKNIEAFKSIIPNNKHILFVLSDGTGSNLINKLDDDSILKRNKKDDIITVFPSTTACVLTSVVTAQFPENHGIWGWFNYDRSLNIDYCPLLFCDRKSETNLLDYGIKPQQVFKQNSLLKNLKTKVNVLFPNYICDSIYSSFVVNKENRYSYNDFNDIVNFMEKNCQTEKESYTYLYLSDIDTLEHENGIDSRIVKDKLEEIENLIEKISENKDLTIIFTADHGQINITKDIILDFEKYNNMFYAYPSIDYGTASYYIKKGYEKAFEKSFKEKYSNDMILFKTEDFINNNFFGIGNFQSMAKDNLGEYISICKKGNYLINNTNIKKYYGKIKGNHSGLSHDEMIIPLIIINTNNQY